MQEDRGPGRCNEGVIEGRHTSDISFFMVREMEEKAEGKFEEKGEMSRLPK